jgi:uncharacterized protein
MLVTMDAIFLPNNSHWHDPARFTELDPNLQNLASQSLVHEHQILDELPMAEPGIYTLGGGRQIGKSTLLKQWMAKLLRQSVAPKSIAFISGEFIDDHHALMRTIQTLLAKMEGDLKYLIIDEVTYINDWDKAIKYAADIRLFQDVVVIVTGSDLALIKQARMTFPGRRGKAKKVNFHLYPLSFREYIQLIDKVDVEVFLQHDTVECQHISWLYQQFERYLCHGGFLTAINDMARHNKILESTLITYAEWIRGDMLKRGKSETYLREIMTALIQRYGTQLSWNAIADVLSIDHPNTVANYCHLLESMDALFIQSALLEDKLIGAPKKAKKIGFVDPFIYHAIQYWLQPDLEPYENQIRATIEHPERCSKLVEACVVAHYKRYYNTYYIKAAGEIDVAYIDNKKFWPVEVKWRNQIRPKDIKQVSKYKDAKILSHTFEYGSIGSIPLEPLPCALLALDQALLAD